MLVRFIEIACEMAEICDPVQWPEELLPDSDDVHCRQALAREMFMSRQSSAPNKHHMWAPKRANGGCDAGIIARAPSASTAGCWPDDVPRDASPRPGYQGFFVAACAPSNANELRRDRHLAVGQIGAVCSRSHQMFMNTTRKCTGTYMPKARQSCEAHDRQPGFSKHAVLAKGR